MRLLNFEIPENIDTAIFIGFIFGAENTRKISNIIKLSYTIEIAHVLPRNTSESYKNDVTQLVHVIFKSLNYAVVGRINIKLYNAFHFEYKCSSNFRNKNHKHMQVHNKFQRIIV